MRNLILKITSIYFIQNIYDCLKHNCTNQNYINLNSIAMFQSVMKVIETLDGTAGYRDIWEYRNIKFDLEDLQKNPHEKYYAISTTISDMKGNPGIKGTFYLSNLRLFWHTDNDKSINFSVGIDTIWHISIKSVPSQTNNSIMHIMVVKAQSPSNTRYEFRYSSYYDSDLQQFQKAIKLHQLALDTKFVRNIDTKLVLKNNSYHPLKGQQIKSSFQDMVMYENDEFFAVNILLTNYRMVILGKEGSLTLAIPWIMIISLENQHYNNLEAVRMNARGILKASQIYLMGDPKRYFNMKRQMKAFAETFNRSPNLGLYLGNDEETVSKPQQEIITEFQYANINIKRNKNPYAANQQPGDLSKTEYNQQLGIMIEKLPEGVQRSDLWQILRE